MITDVCCIGAGYVGGPTMAVMASKCPEINFHVVDINKNRIDMWNGPTNNLPIFEPGLDEIVLNTRSKNLFFSTEIDDAIRSSQMIFISVNTPTKDKGIGKGMASDLKYIELCARKIAEVSCDNKIIVEKSTLPVRTAETLKNIFEGCSSNLKFEVISNPEFLAEGTAIENMLNPDRVLIGSSETKSGLKAANYLKDIYKKWIPEKKILMTNVWSSELSKLVANAFLAQRISSINSISALCEKTDANVKEISKAIGSDSRIGSKFLNASVGFGGSCFQKDILNLVYLCRYYGLYEVADYWIKVIDINDYQKSRFSENIVRTLFNTIDEKIITIFGWSFKKNTNDTRESASIYVTLNLLENGAKIKIFDPQVNKEQVLFDIEKLCKLKEISSELTNQYLKNIIFCERYIDSVKDSHAIALMTEWDIFKSFDWKKIFHRMTKPCFVFDGRLILNKEIIEKIGFNLYQIGIN